MSKSRIPLCTRIMAGMAIALTASAATADRPNAMPTAMTQAVLPVDAIDRIEAPGVDLEAVQIEDAQRELDGLPPRFAIPNDTLIRPDTDGTWEDLGNGMRLWRFRVESPGVLSLNLGFTRYWMPEGGQLIVHSTDGTQVIRPFTANDNEAHGELWTPVVLSDDITIEVTIPAGAVENLDLELTTIGVGYRSFGELIGDDGLRSGSCNVDVVCPEGDGWREEIGSVAGIATGGSVFCTGFMVNNTSNDLTPFFMTADHCGISSSNAASLVTYWNFENSTCRPVGSSGGPGDGPLTQFLTGATYRAGWGVSDFTLVELDDDPDPTWEVHFAGWDRSGVDASSAVAIHHPDGEEKRISFENQPTTVTSYLLTPVPGDSTHVRVEDWDLGTTEPGSSGSPLFDQNHRVIGQLHGGGAACGNDDSDWYGRFYTSWTGNGTPSTRLSDWLDAAGTGAMTVDTISGAGMTVAPTGDVSHLGPAGGPFTNPTIVYKLTNNSPDPVSYQVSLAAGTAPLLLNGSAGPLTGTIPASGGQVSVTLTLDNPASLPKGIYSTPVLFDDLTNARQVTSIHTIEVGQTAIDVTPTSEFITGGPVGGPFNGTAVYTITSLQPSPVTAVVTASDPWISLNGSAGPLSIDINGGIGDTAIVTVGISSAADSLSAGIYNGGVSFANINSGVGDTSRDVTLEAGRTIYVPSDVPQSISDNSTITSTINVPDDFCIGDVDVEMDITHTFIGDLIVELQSPSGVTVRLHDRTGGSAQDIVATYDDDGSGTIPDGPGFLADFDYTSSQGTWTLTVSDNANSDTGSLNNWTLRIAAQGGPCPTRGVVYSFPLDSDAGWKTEGGWAFGTPTGGGGEHGDPDPTSGYTGSYVYGYDLSGDYPNDMLQTEYLETTEIDCSNVSGTRLMFRRWLGVESSTYDHANILVSNDQQNWTTVWENGGSSLSDGGWTLASYDISVVADGEPTVYVRWGMGTTDVSFRFCGWNIDDVEIWGILPAIPGDYDGDGDVDLADFAFMPDCLTGPENGPAAGGCEPFDFDTDDDVDLTDFATFQQAFTGP